MYCPKCGNVMEDVNGALTCVSGNMPLSKVIQNYLSNNFPVQAPRPSGVSVGVELTRWFCPGCGVHLQDLTCPQCGRSIRPMHHSLVELHPHRGEKEAFERWRHKRGGRVTS